VTWTTSKELKAQLLRLWERGELLRDAVNNTTRFPLRLSLKSPNSADISHRFEAVRQWSAELAATKPIRIEWQQVRHRVQGNQQLPASVWINTVEDALNWLGKQQEWRRFTAQLAATQHSHASLLSYLDKRPMQALNLADVWPQLLAVVTWLIEHPRPSIYLRQVDLPNIHSKFIESHRAVLAELLDIALPPNAINLNKSGVSQFAARYGFLEKPTLIRFRVLDPALQILANSPQADISLDADSFSRLNIPAQRVFITENEINYLAFPAVDNAMIIFGAGYGWDALARSAWLQQRDIYYWGDIDTHGFGILNQLRGHFAHVHSLLMDAATLHAHKAVWGREDKPLAVDLNRLSSEERSIYNELRDNRISAGLRLEQEHISFHWLNKYLTQLT